MATAFPWPPEVLKSLRQANAYLQSQQEGLAIPLLRQARSQIANRHLQQELTHRLLRALIRLGLYEDARADIEKSTAAWQGEVPDWMAAMAWRINAHWWAPCLSSRLDIRRANGADAPWLKEAFAQGDFGAAVNREYSARLLATPTPQVAEQLAQQHAQPPADLGAMLMVIELANGPRLGIASLVEIDANNRRAEFIIGFPGAAPHGMLVLEAGTLLADLAFNKLGFHKITVSVYGDNPRLPDLANMLARIGFYQEGLQREHVRLPSGAYADVHLWGGTRNAVTQSGLMQKYARRTLKRP
jgi:RimJ/RimL family protein N-acetyltransferase